MFKHSSFGQNNLKGEFMKKLFLTLALAASILTLSACENSTNLRCATIRDITSPGSENYGVSIAFQDDKRLEESGVDVQIKSDKIGQLTFWQENGQKYTLNIDQKDNWYSLTSLLVIAQQKPDTEKFEKFSEATNRSYLFNSTQPLTLTIRVVAGDIEKNSKETGEVLVGSEDISEEFKLKIEKTVKE